MLYEEYNLSPNVVDILPFDKTFLECDIAHGMMFKGKISQIFHKFTLKIDPGYTYKEKFRGRVQWYMINTKDFLSSINFNLKIENDELVSFNGQLITIRLSIKFRLNYF